MTDKIPRRLEDRNAWSVEDHISYARSGELPLNPEWVEAKNAALDDAGLELDDDGTMTAPEDQSTAQIAERMSRNRLP